MNRFTFLVVGIIILSAAFFTTSLFAQYVPEVLFVRGDPQIMKKGADRWTGCKVKMAVNDGDRIRTSKDESVEVGFVELRKNIVKIGADSDVVVVSGQDPYLINILNGETMALLAGLPKGSNFQIKTPTGLSGARGTGWRSITDGIRSTFESYVNAIYVKGIDRSGKPMDEELIVDRGYKTTVNQFEAPERVERLMAEDFDRWNAWRDEVNSRSIGESAYGTTGAPAAGTAQAPAQAQAGALDRAESAREKLDRIGREEINAIEALEARKQDISESRDQQRIQERQAEQVAESRDSTRESGQYITIE